MNPNVANQAARHRPSSAAKRGPRADRHPHPAHQRVGAQPSARSARPAPEGMHS